MTDASPSLLLSSVQFIGLALLVVVVTRYMLLAGLQEVARAYNVPKKVQGQLLGYATSAPELVGTAATAARGLLGAGLWNIAASNIINCFLFLSAVLYYRRGRTLLQRAFIGELSFTAAAVAVPLVLAGNDAWARAPWMAGLLLGFFVVYLVADRVISNRLGGSEQPRVDEEVLHDVGQDDAEQHNSAPKRGLLGLALLVGGVLGIIIIGNGLGQVAEVIVLHLNVPQVAIGWILGVVTSLPELTTFFAVFAAARGDATGRDACQLGLDNLAASNMSNLGLVYPIGILLFLYATS